MMIFGVCFVLYLIKLSAGKGLYPIPDGSVSCNSRQRSHLQVKPWHFALCCFEVQLPGKGLLHLSQTQYPGDMKSWRPD